MTESIVHSLDQYCNEVSIIPMSVCCYSELHTVAMTKLFLSDWCGLPFGVACFTESFISDPK